MRIKPKGNLAEAAFFLALAFLTILMWPAVGHAQEGPPSGVPQSTPIITNPDDANNVFGENNKAVNAAANGIPGSVDIAAPVREAQNGRHEKVIKVDPAKERKEREKAYHDPTFDGSGLFADIKPPPSAPPSLRVNPTKSSTSLGAGGNFVPTPRLSPLPSFSSSEPSSPAPEASPTPAPTASPAESPAESPSPSPSASPQKSAEPE